MTPILTDEQKRALVDKLRAHDDLRPPSERVPPPPPRKDILKPDEVRKIKYGTI